MFGYWTTAYAYTLLGEKTDPTATARYRSFERMVQCVVHALKGLVCRAPFLLAHAEATKNINIFSMGPKLRYPTVHDYWRMSAGAA